MNLDRYNAISPIQRQINAAAQDSFRRVKNTCGCMSSQCLFNAQIDDTENETKVDRFTKSYEETALLSTPQGGYVVVGLSATGIPEERLSREFYSVQEAQKFMRDYASKT